MTRDEFAGCLRLIKAYWPHAGRDWTPEHLQAWESLLLDLELPVVLAAIQALAADGREWPPPPGLIRQRVVALTNPIPDGDQAWAEVQQQIRRVGSLRRYGEEPTWSHPLIGRIADTLGWDQLCMSENQMADRAHFLRMWTEAVNRTGTADALPPAARQVLAGRGIEIPDLSINRLELNP